METVPHASNQHFDNSLSLSYSMIQSWSQHLRNSKVFEDIDALLLVRPDFACSLLSFLNRLDRTDVTVSLLRQTRVHFALRQVALKHSGWSSRIRDQAEATLIGWQALFGDLDAIVPDPWADGNQLNGIYRIRTQDVPPNAPGGRHCELWAISSAASAEKAFSWGHIGFRVGRWWINAAAAYRDGIIRSFDGVTAGNGAATAIVVDGDQEMHPVSEDRLKYQPSRKDVKTAKILRSLTERKPVRVIRSWQLHSPLSPCVGLRYDGLYYVKSYSLKTGVEKSAQQSFQYTFDMERDRHQPDLDQALAHPTANERDLWEQYIRNKHLHVVEIAKIHRSELAMSVVVGSALGEPMEKERDLAIW